MSNSKTPDQGLLTRKELAVLLGKRDKRVEQNYPILLMCILFSGLTIGGFVFGWDSKPGAIIIYFFALFISGGCLGGYALTRHNHYRCPHCRKYLDSGKRGPVAIATGYCDACGEPVISDVAQHPEREDACRNLYGDKMLNKPTLTRQELAAILKRRDIKLLRFGISLVSLLVVALVVLMVSSQWGEIPEETAGKAFAVFFVVLLVSGFLGAWCFTRKKEFRCPHCRRHLWGEVLQRLAVTTGRCGVCGNFVIKNVSAIEDNLKAEGQTSSTHDDQC